MKVKIDDDCNSLQLEVVTCSSDGWFPGKKYRTIQKDVSLQEYVNNLVFSFVLH